MAVSENISLNSESLIGLLAEQCKDLEKLLDLAREETVAAKEGKFLKIWDIVSERAVIGKRLETFHRQIAELRGHLESKGESTMNYDITNRVIELSNLTLAQDQQTRVLLIESRDQTLESLRNLGKSQQGANAYTREASRGLAYSQNF